MNRYLPEGMILHTEENQANLTVQGLIQAMEQRTIIEAMVLLCDASHNLIIELNGIQGIIPRKETARGIEDGSVKEIAILSRVGKPVCCHVTNVSLDMDGKARVTLSRRSAQEEALAYLLERRRPGDIIPGIVTHLEQFGAFVDVGCGIISLIGIENLSISRIQHTQDRLLIGQQIYAVISAIDFEKKRIELTHKELLGTWQENTELFSVGETVSGIVRSAKEYGIFVELTPNLSGLAEFRPDLTEGDAISVYIKAIVPEKMKIKLIAIEKLNLPPPPSELRYFITDGHIDHWKFAPDVCDKTSSETYF